MEYEAVIGLEIHAELKTKTKMFCNSRNDPDEKRPNTNICPVCMAHPGTLPVINREAVYNVITAGLALNGKISEYSQFDRKNYFYPDLPKGYQISQYKHPLVSGGYLDIEISARDGESKFLFESLKAPQSLERPISPPTPLASDKASEDKAMSSRAGNSQFPNNSHIPNPKDQKWTKRIQFYGM